MGFDSDPDDPKVGIKCCDACCDCGIGCCLDHTCKWFWLAVVIQLLTVVVSVRADAMKIERVEGAWSIYAKENTQMFWAFQESREKVSDLDYSDTCPNRHRRRTQRRLLTDDIDLDFTHEHELQVENTLQPANDTWRSAFSGLQLQPSKRRLEEDEDEDSSTFSFVYKVNEDSTGNIFTPKAIQEICKFEALSMDGEGKLEFYMSVIKEMYGYTGPESEWSCPLLEQSFISAKLAPALVDVKDKGAKSQWAPYVHPSFADNGASPVTISRIRKYDLDVEAWEEKVFDRLDTSYGFMKSPYVAEDDRFYPLGSIRVRMWRDNLDELNKMIYPDFAMVFLSFVIVYIVMHVYMNSAWLAGWGMYQILFSLPCAALNYRILGINYFEFLHILIVYLVLGIGADDIFVLFDTFRSVSKQYPQEGEGAFSREDLHKVMKKTLIRAASAIFNTTFTTTVAFMSASVSEVMPMRTCGWFAALCLIQNYELTMLFTPLTLIIYHRFFQKQRCCCPPCVYREESACPAKEATIEEKNSNGGGDEEKLAKLADPEQASGCLEKFLYKVYVPLMDRSWIAGVPLRIGALAMVVIMLIVGAQGIGWAAALTPPRTAELWVPANHMTLDVNKYLSSNFLTPDYDGFAKIYFYWGIKEFSTEGQDVYKPAEFKNGAVWDSSFDLSTKAAQDEILSVCQKMREAKCDVEGCGLNYKKLMLQVASPQKAYSCFLEDMQEYFGGTLPTGAAFIPGLKEFKTCGENWRNEVYPADNRVMEPNYFENIGFINGELKYVAVAIRSTMRWDLPHSLGTEVREQVDNVVSGWRSLAPSGMNSLKYTAEGVFAGFDLGDELISGFFSGCAISLPVAFIVLLGSTRNIVVSIIAVLSVAFIVLSVLGFCRSAMDWDLGVGEAIAGVIVIGYSVDYVVHLAHIYCEAKHYGCQKRDERCKFAITNLGTTIFAGAVTTAGSGAVMFACYFYFFFKMAILIVITIMYSFLFALLFFMGCLWLIGPENSFGDLCIPKCRKDMDKVIPTDPGETGEK